MSAMFDMSCPGCGLVMRIPFDMAGRSGRCRSCGTAFVATPPTPDFGPATNPNMAQALLDNDPPAALPEPDDAPALPAAAVQQAPIPPQPVSAAYAMGAQLSPEYPSQSGVSLEPSPMPNRGMPSAAMAAYRERAERSSVSRPALKPGQMALPRSGTPSKTSSAFPVWALVVAGIGLGALVLAFVVILRGGKPAPQPATENNSRATNTLVSQNSSTPNKATDTPDFDNTTDLDKPSPHPQTPPASPSRKTPTDPASDLGTLYKQQTDKLDEIAGQPDPLALANALLSFRQWGQSLKTTGGDDWAAEVESEFLRRHGEYYLFLLDTKLPPTQTTWPGLDTSLQRNGAFQLLDAGKLHLTPASRAGCKTQTSPEGTTVLGPYFSPKQVAPIRDFEAIISVKFDDYTDMYLTFHHQFQKSRADRLTLNVSQSRARLYIRSERDSSNVLSEKQFSRRLSDTAELRLISYQGRHTLFVDGVKTLEADHAGNPGRFIFYADGPALFQSFALRLFDPQPPALLQDEYPEDDGIVSNGSGFVVDARGYIVTNHHVIDGQGKIMVRLANGQKPVPAKLIATDDKRDIAIIKIEPPAERPLTPLAVDAKRNLERGEDVAAFGYPLSNLLGSELTLTQGVVSKTPAADNNNLLILSAVVNPGNSGGPLCDDSGNVVGLITFKFGGRSDNSSYGGAVPAPDVAAFMARHIPGFKPLTVVQRNFNKSIWREVNNLVSPSVFMVLKVVE